MVGSAGFWAAMCLAVVAGFMRGFVGVGSGMLMAPLFAIIFGPLATVAIIVLMELAVTIQLLPSVRHLVEWRVILPMGGAAALFMPLGTWLLITVDADLMARGIAAVVLVFVLLLMTGWRYHGPKRLGVTLGVGSVSGALMAATSLGNPPVMLYLLSGSDSAATNRANFTGYFCITLVTLITLMVIKGLIATSAIILAAVLLPVFAAAAWLGSRYFSRANDKLYRRVTLGLLLCVAVFGLLR